MTVRYNETGGAAGLPTALFTKSSPGFTSRLIVGLLGALDSETTFQCGPSRYRTSPPFAGHGLLTFWLAAAMLVLWTCTLIVQIDRAIKRVPA